MPTIDAHDPGTICWIDLASTDAAGATEFYCELFGWTATRADRERGRLPHAAARRPAGGRPRAGLGRHRRLDLVDLRASADADETCAAAVASGGEVVMDAMDVLDAGRMAVLRDPGRRAGLGLAARPASGLRGAQRAGRADLERADDARRRGRAPLLRPGLRLDVAGAGLRRRPVHDLEARRAAGRRRDRDGRELAGGRRSRTGWSTSRRPTATRTARLCARARRHRLASAGRHRPRPLRAARGSRGRRVLGHHAAHPEACPRGYAPYAGALRSEHAVHRDPHGDPRTALPRLDRAQGARRRQRQGPLGAGLRRARRGRPRHRRRRQHVHRLRRRHRLPRRRALQRRASRAPCRLRSRASCTPTSRSCPTTRTSSWPSSCARGCRSRARPRPRSSTAAPRPSRTPSRSPRRPPAGRP